MKLMQMKHLNNGNNKSLLIFVAIILFTIDLAAQLIPSPIIGNGMVIQRGKEFPFSGKAAPGDKVVVALNKKTVTTTTSSDGKWRLKFPVMKEGGPYTLTITAAKQKLSFIDVYVGDVWLASGQSNMAMRLKESADGVQEASTSNNPLIRR